MMKNIGYNSDLMVIMDGIFTEKEKYDCYPATGIDGDKYGI